MTSTVLHKDDFTRYALNLGIWEGLTNDHPELEEITVYSTPPAGTPALVGELVALLNDIVGLREPSTIQYEQRVNAIYFKARALLVRVKG